MEAAEHRERDHLAATKQRRALHRCGLAQTLMWTEAIEVANVLGEHRMQVPLVESDDVIEALAPDARWRTRSSVPRISRNVDLQDALSMSILVAVQDAAGQSKTRATPGVGR